MSRFVLGPEGARKFRELCAAKSAGGRRGGGGPSPVFAVEFPAPYTVKWAASLASDETSEGAGDGTDGEWIIWLPTSGLLKVGQASVDITSDLDDAGGDYPEGWYKLGEALDRDEGGTLYLNVTVGNTPSAEFSDTAGSASNPVAVKICEASVDSETGARTVMQFVTSAIVFGNGGDDDDTVYDCDGKSISRADYSGSDSSTLPGDYFYLKGFGKFTIGESPTVHGFYDAPSEGEIEVDGEATTFAVVCRTGNSSSSDMNHIAYKKLKVKNTGGSSPFAYEKTTTTDPSTQQPVTTHKLVNCCFYWNGELQTLADFDVSGLLNGGTVYLRGTQAAPSSSSPDPTWTWTLGTATQSAPTNGKVLNFKLYDFAQSKVAVDYRTTFLALEDHTQKAKVTVGKPNATSTVVLDASGNTPKLVITNGTKSITLDLADIPSSCGGALAVHELTFTDGNGDEQTYHGLFCDDIDIPEVVQKTISAGDGIAVGVVGNVITITNPRTAGGGSGSATTSGFTGTKYVVTDVTYDETTHKLEKKVETWVYENGLLKTVTVPASMTEITTAVEETV